ncbi:MULTISPECIES: class I SAM-dependent methyltransferase [Streptomyces]|uniref:Class I SAM-dependent methyltransferase n=1 Tax=Streptomyces evansiae TaxID=3075535 RepID=A0ABU2R335_9ACTN|nr:MULTISPECIES: class I SAM-dependent methyltransferase [unclassified Streptomyces]MDT0409829.1 class I SAM-dependent methyltransferase [Streptomyces sp. DSM 41979]MYQ60110.1 methyltransferase domain-containing protein [Streptomyces sp. SID4926]SCE59643.1 Methyltransferase domain-containing protein [Streptomyces sp. DfronAA-171]
MSVPAVSPAVLAFYASTIDESQRLISSADGALELLRTRELLGPLLPSAAKVLDVGGGTGVHARWLGEKGHDVRVVDPVERHVETARAGGIPAEVGDARALSAEDGSYEVVLLLGPLYHLTRAEDRALALAEAFRVVRPGGLVAAAGINRYASLFEHAALAHLDQTRLQESVGRILATGVHDGRGGFTEAYFHTAAGLAEEVTDAGFGGVEVRGVEGPAWGMLKAVERHTGESVTGSPLFESVLAAARMADRHPALAAAGSHLLAWGTRP